MQLPDEKDSILIIGLDLGNETVLVSYYTGSMKEPNTISVVAGKEKYQIPAVVFEDGQGTCFFGEEALQHKDSSDGLFFEGILEQSAKESGSGPYTDHLALLIKRLIRLAKISYMNDLPVFLGIAVPEMKEGYLETLDTACAASGVPKGHYRIMDYGESFFYHTLHQEHTLWSHDVAAYDYNGDNIRFFHLERDGNSAVVLEREIIVPGQISESGSADGFFSGILKETLSKRIFSSVYLTGNGYDGGWLRESLRTIGPNRRAFLGKNLYANGACYAAGVTFLDKKWPYKYNCSYKIQKDVHMKVERKGHADVVPLALGGCNWFESMYAYELIYRGTPQIELMVGDAGKSGKDTHILTLDDLPERPARSLRLKLTAKPKNADMLSVEISDSGFGAFYKSSGKHWLFHVPIS